jgi:hypothetical protein
MVRLLILLFAFSFSLIAKEPICTWTSADGRTLGIFASTLVNPIMGYGGIPIFIN